MNSFLIHGTSGFINTSGIATVTISQLDPSNGTLKAESATFEPNEVYVGTDATNQGIGFGSRIFPIYPYALFGNPIVGIDLNDPQYNLQQNVTLTYSAMACVWPPGGGQCLNQPGVASNYVLMTDKGGFWVTANGPTRANFTSALSPVPEPASVLQVICGATWLALRRRQHPRAMRGKAQLWKLQGVAKGAPKRQAGPLRPQRGKRRQVQ